MVLARAGLTATVIDSSGNIQAGASVTVYEEDGSTLLVQPMYSAKTGGTALANPTLTNNLGRLTLYATTAQRVVLSVGGINYVSAFESDPADIVLESGGQTVDGLTLTTATLTAPTMSGVKITDTLRFTEVAAALSDPGAGFAILKVDTSGDLLIFPTGGAAVKFTKSGAIVNADVNAAAALALTKIAQGAANTVVVTNSGATALTTQLLQTANVATGGQIVKQLLAYNPSTDLQSGGTVNATTWTDVFTNQSFTVDDANSLVEFAMGGGMTVLSATAGALASSRLVIDSAGTPINKVIGLGTIQVSSQGANPLAGAKPFRITGLSAGAHTAKLQVWCTAAATMNALMTTVPNTYSLSLEVTEFKR